MSELASKEDLEMKVRGLLERISAQAATYENTIADLRVALTKESKKNEELRELLTRPQEWAGGENTQVDTIEGEVVE